MGKQVYSTIVELERELHAVVEAVDVTKHVTGTPDRLTLTTQRGDIEADGGLAHLRYDLRVVGGETLERHRDRELHRWDLDFDLLYQVTPGHNRDDVYDLAAELAHEVVRAVLSANRCVAGQTEGPPVRSWVAVRGKPSGFLRLTASASMQVFLLKAAS